MNKSNWTRMMPARLSNMDAPLTRSWRNDYFQLVSTRESCVTFSINKQRYSLSPGNIALVFPGSALHICEGELSDIRIVSFHSTFVEQSLKLPTNGFYLFPMNDKVSTLHNGLWDGEGNSATKGTIRSSGMLFSLLLEFNLYLEQFQMNVPLALDCPSRQLGGKPIIYAARYMQQNMHDSNLSLNDVANFIAYHPNYFCQEFKFIMKLSPMKYLRELRLMSALLLIRDTDLPIGEICRAVGIKKTSSITSMIKEKIGMTPMAYRRHLRSIS